ncbi:MAG TPA: hypothetical protein VED01_24885 [Burkholderiales bacterium]|nr:hypothetical protein [Burkholderiales bacterium]
MPDKPDEKVLSLARAAGLDKIIAEFPEELVAAAKVAGDARSAFAAPDDAAIEPWPPMKTGGAA